MTPDPTFIQADNTWVKFQEYNIGGFVPTFYIFGAIMTANEERRNSPSTQQRVAWDLKHVPEIAQQPGAVDIFCQNAPGSDFFDLPKAWDMLMIPIASIRSTDNSDSSIETQKRKGICYKPILARREI
jgi:hypothetical protein